MGFDFYLCDNCEESRCSFINCSCCCEQSICENCLACSNYNIFNVIYFKNTYKTKGYDEHIYICDNCFKNNLSDPTFIFNNNDEKILEYKNLILEKTNLFKNYYIEQLTWDIEEHQEMIESLNKKINKLNDLISDVNKT
jgi:hypothetical protein